eukprot:COSAG05_NODE_639_length_8156_cov_122.162840_6_plen_92_part_00
MISGDAPAEQRQQHPDVGGGGAKPSDAAISQPSVTCRIFHAYARTINTLRFSCLIARRAWILCQGRLVIEMLRGTRRAQQGGLLEVGWLLL